MFDSVLAQNVPRRQVGRGAILSVVVHVVLIAAAVYISSRPHEDEKKSARKVMLFNPPPPPPPPPAGGGAVTKPKVEKKKVIKKPDTVIQTTKKETPKPQEQPKPREEPEPGGVEGGVKGGVAGGVVGGVVGGTGAVPFGVGMNRPVWLSNPAPIWSREAAAIRVTGTALVKCVITVQGTLQNCKIIKGLPHMDPEILAALKEWRATPVMFQGRPVSVEYVIPVKVVAP
jgi:periplasmic protein TonB